MTTVRTRGGATSTVVVDSARRIRFVVVAIIATLALVFAPGFAPTARAADPVTPPVEATLLGDLVDGQTVFIQSDPWVPFDIDLTYQWWSAPQEYSAAAGADPNPGATAIPGATDGTLTLEPGLIDSWIWVVITGSADGFDPATRIVASTAAVVASTFASVPDVSITGTARVGSTLTATLLADPPANATVTYQWQRDDSNIDGATAKTYAAQSADYGRSITVQVWYWASSIMSVVRTSAEVVPGPGPATSAPTPKLSGTVRVGKGVGISTAGWPGGWTFSYGWKIVDTKGKVTTSSSKASTYKPASWQRGMKLIGVLTGKAPGYSAVTKQTSATTIGYGVFTAPTPTISGSPYVGATLKVSIGTWSPKASSHNFRWKRNGVAISGATKTTYKLTSSDYGKKITVSVAGQATGYTTKAVTSAATATITKPFTKVYTPTISGHPNIGQTLTVKITAWSPSATFTYQWKRDDVAIAGATARTYVVTGDDANAKITVTVAGKRSGYYTRVLTSAATLPVGPSLDFVQYQVGVDMLPGTYYSDGGVACTFQRQGAGGFDEYLGGNIYEGTSFAGPRVVTIAEGDAYFFTAYCGPWRTVTTSLKTSVGNGTYVIGSQISAGKWKLNSGYVAGCYVEFLSAFTGTAGDRITPAPTVSASATTITIPTTAKGFTTNGCGTWTKVG